jgi:valyl-tRNA synthetase
MAKDIVVGIRNIRAEYKVEPGKYIGVTIVSPHHDILAAQREVLARLARLNLDELSFVPTLANRSKAAATVIIGDIEVFVPLAGLIDLDARAPTPQQRAHRSPDRCRTPTYPPR